MSVGFIGSKHTVYDVYPLRGKKVFVLVDPQNVLDMDQVREAPNTLSTIAYLLEKEASVVVASSFGPLTGILMNLSRKERELALHAFKQEHGMGYTNFFSALPPDAKMSILSSVEGLSLTREMSNVPNTGKTTLFGSLTTAQKIQALHHYDPHLTFAPVTTLAFVDAISAALPEATVHFAPDSLRAPIHELKPGEVMVLENLRFYKNETSAESQERSEMADVLAADLDIFINDSFGTAFARHASTIELPRRLQHGAAGLAMDRELAFYSKFLGHPARPLALVMAGHNIQQKMHLLHSLVGRVDRVLLGGAIAFPFLAAKGLHCGRGYPTGADELTIHRPHTLGNKSVSSQAIPCSQYARELLALFAANNMSVVLPVDHIINTNPEDARRATRLDNTAIPPEAYAVDCGTKTVMLFCRCLRDCRTVVWTGTFGWAAKGYVEGSTSFAASLAQLNCLTIVSGRYTMAAVHAAQVWDKIQHGSSGSMSCLEVLQGAPLPGVEALSDVVPPAGESENNASLSVNELVRRLPLFMGCSSHQLKIIARKFIRREHVRGDYLVNRGDRHVRLFVVARGGLVATCDEESSSAPARFISKGQTIGMYEFITQAAAMETVRVAHKETVTYQLTSSALNELLNAQADLSAQLFQNLSTPLWVIANDDYQQQQDVASIATRNASRVRVPQPGGIPQHGSGFWLDLLSDLISTVALQSLTMRYTPYVEMQCASSGLPARQLKGIQSLQLHQGLPCTMLLSVARNVLYHQCVHHLGRPWLGSVLSSILVSPLRLLAYGITYNDINFKLVLDEALCGAAVSGAPLAAYAMALTAQRRIEHRRGVVPTAVQLLLLALSRLVLGLAAFPIIFQRNFVYTQPSASRWWSAQAFRAYEAKQVALILIRYLTQTLLKLISVTPPPPKGKVRV